jgi:hypothetical protein
VEGLVGEEDPFEAVSSALRDREFDRSSSRPSSSTSPWLRRDLPHRIEELGVPVTRVTKCEEREVPVVPGVRSV